ncbi:MAG: cell division protein ZipA C-terminal FtsZ-binding domain-containing protein [Chromatiaceae bacterium]|nr:cell division protein ZipA C-terminal FtsZ-binding domain-containing protein [Chromatiaceae bacterium]MCF7994977.1 cell division protein ZipA C-terminal FtsZ-binding domain-containing protein [Chromatiaceae bacterium]MCF8015539.1 cell division protein ZipA C-terminal FtsZ-binding domain-containing protein [Chromatiaceae bacterium]
MDAGTLRIILIILGALLLVALYYWERRRIEGETQPDDLDKRERQRSAAAWRREPSFGRRVADEVTLDEAASDADAAYGAHRSANVASASAATDDDPSADDPNADDAEPARAGGSGLDAPERVKAVTSSSMQEQRPSSRPTTTEDGLLVQLFLVARDQHFDGSAVQAAAERQHLTPGEMDIYHRRNLDRSSERALFSMANLVNPGTFPFDAMERFTTPGVALFTQLDGMPSDLMVYDEFVQSARTMADELGADLLLPNRRPFDEDAWEGYRIELLSLINDRADALIGGDGSSRSEGSKRSGGSRPADAENGDDEPAVRR